MFQAEDKGEIIFLMSINNATASTEINFPSLPKLKCGGLELLMYITVWKAEIISLEKYKKIFI